MTAEALWKHLKAVPYYPFCLRAPDGRVVPVLGRDCAIVTPSGRRIFVFQPDGSRDILEVEPIPGVEFGPPPAVPVQ